MTAMDKKIQKLDEYIEKLDNAIESNNESEAEQLRREIIAVYEYEIDGIRNGLDAYSADRALVSRPYNDVHDARLLRAKLENYKLNLESGLYTVRCGNDSAVNIVQNNQQEMHSNITITLQQTISDINSLPENILSDEDKEILCGKLATLSAEKNSKSQWEKAQGILKWIANKSFELGKVALPYVLQAIQNTSV